LQRVIFELTREWTTRIAGDRAPGRTLTIKALFGRGAEELATVIYAYKFVGGLGPTYLHIRIEGDTADLDDQLKGVPADCTLRLTSARVGDRELTEAELGSESGGSAESGASG